MSTIKQLKYLFDKKTKRRMVALFILILISSLLELLGITIILPIVNLAMDSGDFTDNSICNIIMRYVNVDTKEEILLFLIGVTIAIYLIKNAFICFIYYKQFRFAADIKMNLSTRLMAAYLKQPYKFFLNVNSADLMRSVSTDTDQLYQLISNIFSVLSNGITALIIIIFLAASNPIMTLSIALIMGICLCIIVFGLQKVNRRNGRMCQYLAGQVLKHLRQAFEGIKEIKIMNSERYFIDTYGSTYKKSADLSVKNSLIATLPKYLIEVFAISAILVYLAFNIMFNSNYIELVPQLAVFCVAAFKLLPSVNALYASFNMIVYYKASIDLVYNDIKTADELENDFNMSFGTNEELPFKSIIKVEKVTFRYPGTEKDVIVDANIEIPRGESVAFIGASGGGKTTTADIVLALLNPDKGKITVDDIDINNNIRGWKSKIGYIPQTIYLIDDTIRANIAFGINSEAIDDVKVWKSLEDAQLKDYIESLPKGLDTEVGERGVRLSGGQRQRIGIARALYRNPEILVFDEATSALDNETEKEVMKAIDGLHGTKTILMIAHRLSTIEKCNRVYKVENGTVTRER